MDENNSVTEAGRPSPEAATEDPAIAKATELQEVTHNGFVGNWDQERRPVAEAQSSPSPVKTE